MSHVASAPPPRVQRRCRYRIVGVMRGRFAVIERLSGNVVEAGFTNYEAGWEYIANRL
jgi:hypothetical protein